MKSLNEQVNARRPFQLRRRRGGDGAGGRRFDGGRRRIESGIAAGSRRAARSLSRVGGAMASVREMASRVRTSTTPVTQWEASDSASRCSQRLIAEFGAMVAPARSRASRSSSCCGGSDMSRARSSQAPGRTDFAVESLTYTALSRGWCAGAGAYRGALRAIRVLRRGRVPREASLGHALWVPGTSGEVREMNGTS